MLGKSAVDIVSVIGNNDKVETYVGYNVQNVLVSFLVSIVFIAHNFELG